MIWFSQNQWYSFDMVFTVGKFFEPIEGDYLCEVEIPQGKKLIIFLK